MFDHRMAEPAGRADDGRGRHQGLRGRLAPAPKVTVQPVADPRLGEQVHRTEGFDSIFFLNCLPQREGSHLIPA